MGFTVAGSDFASTFTMSLTRGWDMIPPEQGGRPLLAGDTVFLEVIEPQHGVGGPPGWAREGNLFWRQIGPCEPDPSFSAPCGPGAWKVRGWAFTGIEAEGATAAALGKPR